MASDTVEDQPETGEQETPEPDPAKAFLLRVWDFIRPIVILIVILFALRSSIADWNDVPTGSMIPTILEGDRIFVNKLAYDLKIPFTTRHIFEWADPKRGDIVVFFSPDPDGTRLVKRCVAVPGDHLQVVGDQLMINDVPVSYTPLDPASIAFLTDKDKSEFIYGTENLPSGDEKAPNHLHPIRIGKLYHNANPNFNFGPVTVPQGKYFMMGDNRDNSRDSRWFGFVDRSSIVGRASAVAISFDINHHWIPRWARFFSSLP